MRTVPGTASPAAASAAPPGTGRRLLRLARRDLFGAAGVLLVTGLVLLSLIGPLVAPYPEEGRGTANVAARNLAPGSAHLFGTDELGRDILSRIVFGAQPALLVSLAVVLAAALIGVPLGALAGYRGGWADQVISRITELFQSFPPLLLAMVTVALLGPGLLNAGIALAVVWWPWYARLVRAEARSLRDRPFVEAARSMGVPVRTILRRHVVRNCAGPILVQITVDLGSVILAAGSLAFLGLGAQQPSPDWGLMVAAGRGTIFDQWWISTFPGLAIFVTVLGFNLLGDSLRDLLDPKSVRT
ncbi:ABC transporter permease [Streptomyces sp. F63]|uniref:ABC transporter permease n=1 Tax=Streptomyces sp. F63 TaxID=2824887 RepID=UPI001B395D7F|nr:ABC transporter permease [Streptomyces sp. F63]MBQ0985810.1 ABC transporter permease [Streptomyces sp. F63]